MMYMSVSVSLHVYTCSWRAEKGAVFPGTGVIGCGELPCGCWEPKPDPWQEQPMFLIIELSL